MDENNDQGNSNLSNQFGTKDILLAVVGKLSSQLLLFSVAIVVLIVSAYIFIGSDALVPTVAILLVFILGAIGYLFIEQQQKLNKGDTKTINTLLGTKMQKIVQNNVSPRNNGLKIELWVDKVSNENSNSRDVSVVQTKSGESFRIGEKINIKFKSSKNCYLTLLNVGTSGKLTILYPNNLHKDNFIEGDKLYEIPRQEYKFEYQLEGPPGTEKLKAIVTETKIDLVESQFSSDGAIFKTISSSAAARDISTIEKKVEQIPQDKWNEAYFEFNVL